ncbi:MAG: HD domain-containing protein [Bacteroidota bacterium]
MSISSTVLIKVSKHVNELFDRKSTIAAMYHNFDHTLDVVANVKEIAKAMDLSGDKTEVIVIAAWFHDTGYLFSPVEHEERSVKLATTYLKKIGYPEKKIAEVAGCIRATKVPQHPKNTIEKVMSDADLLSLGKKDSIEKGEMLRAEIENLSGKVMSEKNWVKQSIAFFQGHHYHTDYAIQHYSENRERNLKALQAQLEKLERPRVKKPAAAAKTPAKRKTVKK